MVVRARWIHQYFYWCALRDSIVVNFQYFDHNPFTRRNIFIFVVVRTTQKLNRIYGVHYSRQTVRALWISNEPTNPNKLQIELCACLTSLIFFWTIFDSLQPTNFDSFPFSIGLSLVESNDRKHIVMMIDTIIFILYRVKNKIWILEWIWPIRFEKREKKWKRRWID